MRILLADDDETLRTELGELLKDSGYDVTLAADGEEALRHLERTSFDVALLDVSMPGPSGLEVLRRGQVLSPATSIIMISGRSTIDMAVEAMKAGADDFVAKPFGFKELEATLRKFKEKIDGRRSVAAGSPDPNIRMALMVHRNGCLIGARVAPGEQTGDEDLVAATLAVIQNFMQTAFPRLAGKELRSIVQGDSVLLVEPGAHSTLAVLSQGGARADLRRALQEHLTAFEAQNGRRLERWNGDPEELQGVPEALDVFLTPAAIPRSAPAGSV